MKAKIQSILSARSEYSGSKTLNDTVCRRLSALGLPGILFISVCALLPSPASAQCKRWDVSGQWELELSNGSKVQVNLQQGDWQQQSANLTGTGLIATPASNKSESGQISGNITDKLVSMKFTIGGTPHRFEGTVGPGGKIQGTTDNGAHWVGGRRMKCADQAIPGETPRRPRSG